MIYFVFSESTKANARLCLSSRSIIMTNIDKAA